MGDGPADADPRFGGMVWVGEVCAAKRGKGAEALPGDQELRRWTGRGPAEGRTTIPAMAGSNRADDRALHLHYVRPAGFR